MFIADFHIHSKYSRATSKECVPEILELWARRKGLDLIGTGGFTHRVWREELKEKLIDAEEGLYKLKEEFRQKDNIAGTDRSPRFIVTGEISSIYKKNGKVRKVHNLLLLPSLEDAEILSKRLESIGNLHSDGRPILGLDSRDLLEIALEVAPRVIFIPAHIWTPHFSLFGAYSGFDDIRECFEDLTDNIHALETGLSSDPAMNWRLSALDGFTLVSNSDAHSPANLAREANIFDTSLSYQCISKALETGNGFGGTIEFFPEEGKYHYDGHRNCGVCFKPSETKEASGVCPVCGGRITVGVLSRVEALADRDEGFAPANAKRFESLVPLHEVIASSMGMTTASSKVKAGYQRLIQTLGPELFILREAPLKEIEHIAGVLITEGIRRLRSGRVDIHPGYDGEYGKIKLMDKDEIIILSGQLSMFGEKVKDSTDKLRESSNKGKKESRVSVKPGASSPALKQDPHDILSGLNPEQLEAVTAPEPIVAVIAGPGTGKTKTLISRIVYLIEKCGARPSDITAVTFTNKAAGEMCFRLEQHFGKRIVKDMSIGTFHSIALKMLSRQAVSCPSLIDEQSSLSIIQEILQSLGLSNPAREVLRGISLIKNGALEKNSIVPPVVYDMYNKQLERYGAWDYDDILINALDMADKNAMDTKNFTHLLVDEFQDINAIQYRLIKVWSKNSLSIFIIGDPDQSIYGFRGSDPKCFNQFFKDSPSVRRFSLIKNYRSTPEIVSCAQSIILDKTAGKRISLQEAGRESGAKVRLVSADNSFSEAMFTAKEISCMVGGIEMTDTTSGGKRSAPETLRSFSDIAVLYRTNRQSFMFEQCLTKEGIPYIVAGRDEFLSDQHVLKTVSFFRFLLDTKNLLAFRTCLKDSGLNIQGILEKYINSDKSISSITEILKTAGESAAARLAGLIQKYEPLVRKENPVKLIEYWINDNPPQEPESMAMLLNTSVMHGDMQSFLYNLTLGRESDVVRSGGRHYTLDAVTLTTLHGAKGLEYPVVFLGGVTEDMIPFRDRFGNCNSDEERRLFYVGLTRAKDELIVLTSGEPSPFLSELPEESLVREASSEHKQSAHQLSLFDF